MTLTPATRRPEFANPFVTHRNPMSISPEALNALQNIIRKDVDILAQSFSGFIYVK